ncbi:MAG: DUF2339 domain-containing protein [Candidatus Hydrothermarchaeales archaeon]
MGKSRAEARRGLELDIGRKWLNKIGIISLVLGITFFIKYSLEQDYLGPVGKIIVGILAGLALLVAGEIFDRWEGYHYLARSLTGGSFAVLYITIYAAHHLYGLIPQYLDLAVLGIIVALGVIFSLKYNSRAIASEAFFLGYFISLMNEITTFTLLYSLLLTAGLIVIAERRNWGSMGLGGLAAAYLIHFGFRVYSENFTSSGLYLIAVFILLAYLVRGVEKPETQEYIAFLGLIMTYWSTSRFPHGSNYLLTVIFFLAVFFLLFNLLSLYMRSPTKLFSIIILLVNALFFYSPSYNRIGRLYDPYLGLFTVAIAGAYLGLAYAATNKRLVGLSAVFLALCITFVTIAIPVQFNDELITLVWAIEGMSLLYLGFRFDVKNMRYLGNGVGVVTLIKTVFVDSSLYSFDTANLLASTRFFAYLAPIITFYASTVLYRRNEERIDLFERDVGRSYFLGGSLLLTLILALELEGWHITGAWAIEALIFLVLGLRPGMTNLRLFSTGVGGIIMAKVLFVDASLRSFELGSILAPYTRLLAFVVPIVTFYTISVIYRWNKAMLADREQKLERNYMVAATLLVTYILALELKGGYISAAWAIEAIVLLIAGFHYKQALPRILGMVLLGVTTFKVFIIDLASLETIYRILSFIVLGIILLIASYAYTRYRYIFEEEA